MTDEYYQLVPKELSANLAFRAKLIRMGCKDPKVAHQIWMMCSRSVLFYFNTMLFLHEPRPRRSKNSKIPFITWDYQDEAILELVSAIEAGENRCVVKSRDMGASWMILAVFEWFWHFRENQTFLLVSRNEDYVDNPGDMKALLQKVDFIHDFLPRFMRPRMTRVKNHVGNDDNGSAMNGESTTGELAAGNRLTAIMVDEFAKFKSTDGFKALASTQFASDCRIFNSTYETTADAFYAVSKNAAIKNIELPWWKHPVYSKGLYRDKDDKPRSPWYDDQCKMADDPRIIARELDMNPEGAQAQFFLQSDIEKIIKEKSRDPVLVGELDFEAGSGMRPVFIARPVGRLKLWIGLSEDGTPAIATEQFSIGADIATGTGASNSVLAVTNRLNGIKIAEWTDSNTKPDDLAIVAVALARWLNNALIVPEANGPGRNFIDMVMNDLHYSNIYYHESIRVIDKRRMVVPGWWNTSESKWELFGEYRKALVSGAFDNPSEPALRECLDYVYFGKTVWHAAALKSNNDPSSEKDNHGDRAMADALSWKGVRYSPVSKDEVANVVIPPNSIAGRRAWHEKRKRERELAWH